MTGDRTRERPDFERRGGGVIGSIGSLSLQTGRRLFDLVLPPRCKKCGALVVADDALCAACWSSLTFLGPPWCACCGLPFEYDVGADALCGACIASRPLFGSARAALAYDDASRELVLSFKHGGDESLARLFACWMAAAGGELLHDAPVILPVPLHPWRRIRRGFNQSAGLAAALARITGLRWDALSLERVRSTPSQGGLGRLARRENVRAAFAVRHSRRQRLAGRNLLLVDDVWTSGATADACIRACRKAGAARVDLLTLARVL
ncbi:ComF family protein [Nisaea acidiphila]|uniref:ComF family protein n=1 Tax=Nisaea acidiphila TaxID=1862145 RepID=A0A9J7AV99_9PROT|nr:ComF family protein [Nisaea acidiphila]UUX51691.1 ComF family protein [Nisaea acidiphila]